MSRQFSSAIMFVSVVAIALAANRAEENSDVDSAGARAPASIDIIKKEQTLGVFKAAPILRHTEKLHGPLYVTLKLAGPNPDSVGDVFVLQGSLTTKENLTDVAYNWSLPPGLELVNGQLAGHAAVSATEPTLIEISLRKTTLENLQVHLLASSNRDGSLFADSAQYNTELQKAIDAKKEEMKKATAAAATANGEELKVFH